MSGGPYLVDTNVISERMKPQPNPQLLAWVERHAPELYLSSVTVDELWCGVQMMPRGKRRDGYRQVVETIVARYPEKVLGFGASEALLCAEYRCEARRSGQNPGVQDMMIAAIARANGMTLATRNVKDFSFLRIPLVNPFETDASAD